MFGIHEVPEEGEARGLGGIGHFRRFSLASSRSPWIGIFSPINHPPLIHTTNHYTMTSSTLTPTATATPGKPNVLILGGVGFVGRNLVTYLVERQVCARIRVVDKVLPATAYFTARQQKAFHSPCVDYRQGNLVHPGGFLKPGGRCCCCG